MKKLVLAAIIVGSLISGAAAQQPAAQQPAAQQPAPASNPTAPTTWHVKLKNDNGGYFLTVRGKDVPLKAIAAELSNQLKAPVILSRVMEKQKVTLDFEDLALESALQMMAPLPYVHYELRGGSTPICREVFLTAYNEPVPTPKLENKGVSFVFQGNTEDTGDKKDDPLRVSYRKERLSVTVKKQSITAVLDRIASELGINFSMKQDSDETIDLDFKELSLEDALSYFPADVHMHVRKDIQRGSTLPLLIEYTK